MIKENRTSKYLLYAIGEIVLVVIGILIALSINNWNENRKNNNFEYKILQQIQKNLIQDRDKIKLIQSNRKKTVSSIDKIMSLSLTNNLPDSTYVWLANIFQFDRFSSLTNTYETLKAKSVSIIKNNDLRYALGNYYDSEVPWIILNCKDVENVFFNDWLPILDTDFIEFKWKNQAIPKSLNDFSNNELYLNKIKLRRDLHEVNITVLKSSINKLNELILKIESEISN